MRAQHSRGFTLIELMIAVAVVGILAAIAYPSYQDSIRKSRRADAKGVLLQAAQWMERNYTENNCYHRNTPGTCSTAAVTTTLPASVSKSPTDGANTYYNITLVAAGTTANAFTLQAAPTSTGNQSADTCKTLTLTSTGVKGANDGGSSLSAADITTCWR